MLDIDGTLTPLDVLVAVPRPGAAKAVSTYASKGYEVIYISVRIPMFQAGLRDWLQKNGFPPGILHVAHSGQERAHPEDYKARVIGAYFVRGWKIAFAYGDSPTDFEAYALAKVPSDHVFALKRFGSDKCQVGVYKACLDGWTEHLDFVEQEVPRLK